MIHKEIHKVKDQNGMYLVFCTKTFQPVFLTNIDSHEIIMDAVAMNKGFRGIELKQSDKRYYLTKIMEYHSDHKNDISNFVYPLGFFDHIMETTSLAQVTLDFLNILHDNPMIKVDGAFMAFTETDRDIVDANYSDPVSIPVIFDMSSDEDLTKKIRANHHTW